MLKQEKKIGLLSAVIICMNSMIGGGIFANTLPLISSTGPAAILTYCFIVFAVIFMAINVARVASLYPGEGAFYRYAKEWGGHHVGLFAYVCYISGIILALSALTQIAASTISSYFPEVSYNLAGVGLILAIMCVNLVGIKIVQAGQALLIACTLFSLVIIIVMGFLNAKITNLVPFMPYGWESVAKAAKTALFAFFGFETVAAIYSTVKNPEKNVPLALLISVSSVGIIYIAFISSIMASIPIAIFSSGSIPLSKAIAIALPKYSWLAKIISVSILTSIIGVIQGISYGICKLSMSLQSIISAKKQYLSFFQINLAVVGIVIFNFFMIKNINIIFCLTAILIILALLLSMITLILKNKNKTIAQKISTFIGVLTGLVILISSVYDLIKIFIEI